MDRVNIRPPEAWSAMTREEKLAWALTIVEETRVASEAGGEE